MSRVLGLLMVVTCALYWASPMAGAKSGSDSFEAIMQRATELKKSRQSAAAAEAFTRALKLRPNDAEAHAGLGWALFEMQMLDTGLAEVKRAVELNPRSAIARHHLAVMYMTLGMLPQAADEFRAEYAIDPSRNCNCGPSNALMAAFPPGAVQAVDSAVEALEKHLSSQPARTKPDGAKTPSDPPGQKR